jgi:dipeptidyl aminopeptidase/acylaminoacyl peptidase
MTARSIANYGTWKSEISAGNVADVGMGSILPITELKVIGEYVYWIERKSDQGGRQVVVQSLEDGSTRDRVVGDFNARTTVHEYGGGSYCAYQEVVFFSNFEDQRIYRVEHGSEPKAITPEPARTRATRYADSITSQDGRWLIAVRERHESSEEVFNELVVIPTDGSDEPQVIASGHDFYSTPKLSPDGQSLAWLSWNHPQMPWNGTELWVAKIDQKFGLSEGIRIAGGSTTSIFQPEWAQSGVLHFISDKNGWWNLYKYAQGKMKEVLLKDVDIGYPHWIFGISRYAHLSDGQIALIYSTDGIDQLALLNPADDTLQSIEIPFTSFSPPYLRCDHENALWVIAGSAYEIPSVIRIDPISRQFEVVHRGSNVVYDPELISAPRSIEYSTTDAKRAYAFFYEPKNPEFQGPEGALPPLIVKSHGGPTSAARCHLQLEIQYWTSRGFAVVDVNYGGSTGFGRAYRERLEGTWGIVDSNDCIAAAQYLVDQGWVDGDRLIIRGGSAGGFTTLSALTFHDVFTAGASYYGVPDLKALSLHTHKFEAHYLDRLLGPLPEAEKLYYARSPIHFTDRLSCPMILLQGLEDRVVPPSQAETMIDALEEKGLPYAYVAFDNERHGFRRRENVIRSLEAEYSFYAQIFGFQPSEPVEGVEIQNLHGKP